ncbi:MAG: hypothetical protein IJ343_10535 [Clostridia bacterium]|nr:hypothetical protein [Clostridia bacterium]
MSCACIAVITGMDRSATDALLTSLRSKLAGTPICLFCPPQYEEPFLHELPPAERLVLSFADNPDYDNCDRLFQTDAADCMHLLAEAAGLILDYGCGCELFISSMSGAALADYTAQPVTPQELHRHLTAISRRRSPGFYSRFILCRCPHASPTHHAT